METQCSAKEKKVHDTLPGLYLTGLGILVIIVSVFLGYGAGKELTRKAAINHLYSEIKCFSESEVLLIDTVIFGFMFIGVLIGFVLIGLGSVVKSLHNINNIS